MQMETNLCDEAGRTKEKQNLKRDEKKRNRYEGQTLALILTEKCPLEMRISVTI